MGEESYAQLGEKRSKDAPVELHEIVIHDNIPGQHASIEEPAIQFLQKFDSSQKLITLEPAENKNSDVITIKCEPEKIVPESQKEVEQIKIEPKIEPKIEQVKLIGKEQKIEQIKTIEKAPEPKPHEPVKNIRAVPVPPPIAKKREVPSEVARLVEIYNESTDGDSWNTIINEKDVVIHKKAVFFGTLKK